MMYVEFYAGNEEYKLRLNTRNIVALEKQLGCNPVMIFGSDGDTIPTVTVMVTILHAALQPYQHGINLDKAFDIFDAWVADGNNSVNFAKVILDIYKVSGIIPNSGDEDSGKN